MLSRNSVRNTTRDYPWAKVFFGFVGGMILCNLAVNLLASIKIIVATVMQVSLADVVSLRRSSWFGGMQDVTTKALPGQ